MTPQRRTYSRRGVQIRVGLEPTDLVFLVRLGPLGNKCWKCLGVRCKFLENAIVRQEASITWCDLFRPKFGQKTPNITTSHDVLEPLKQVLWAYHVMWKWSWVSAERIWGEFFRFGLASFQENSWQISQRNLMAKFIRTNFGLVFPGLQASNKKNHAQTCRHSFQFHFLEPKCFRADILLMGKTNTDNQYPLMKGWSSPP